MRFHTDVLCVASASMLVDGGGKQEGHRARAHVLTSRDRDRRSAGVDGFVAYVPAVENSASEDNEPFLIRLYIGASP